MHAKSPVQFLTLGPAGEPAVAAAWVAAEVASRQRVFQKSLVSAEAEPAPPAQPAPPARVAAEFSPVHQLPVRHPGLLQSEPSARSPRFARHPDFPHLFRRHWARRLCNRLRRSSGTGSLCARERAKPPAG